MNVSTLASRDHPSPPDATLASWYALTVLILVGLYAFVDRQVFVLQAEPIRQQMSITDFQLGLLQGLGVALFASLAAYPIGWLADRFDRRMVLSGCIVIWSLAVVGCGFASNFTELFIASAMVGAGEAGFTPIVYALIPELFFGKKRILANAIVIISGRAGMGLAIALCGYIIQGVEVARPWLPLAIQSMEGWRLAFFAAALPGPVIVMLVLSISLRRRLTSAATLQDPTAAPQVQLARLFDFVLPNKTTFATFFLGMGFAVIGFSSLGTWLPIVAMRQFTATPVQVGNMMGLATVVATFAGMFLTFLATRVLTPRLGALVPVVVLRWSALSSCLAALLLPFSVTSEQLFFIFCIQMSLMMTGMMVYPTALQDFAPRQLRGRIIGLLTVVLFLFSAASPPAVGLISDLLKEHHNGLLLAVVGFSATTSVLATIFLWWCARTYLGTVQAARSADDE